MKHYDSIPKIQEDRSLSGDMVWGFNKLDGQNLCVTYKIKTDSYGPFGSRNVLVDETSEQLGDAVAWFKKSYYPDILSTIAKLNQKKGYVFNGVTEITYFFEWYGPNSFAGKHQPGDIMHLALIDIFIKKKGYMDYMEPGTYYALYNATGIELPKLIYIGKLNLDIIKRVQENDWTSNNPEFPEVKEGVVFKRSRLLKGQRRPSVKVKTNWWINKLHSLYTNDECKLLE